MVAEMLESIPKPEAIRERLSRCVSGSKTASVNALDGFHFWEEDDPCT